MTKNSVIAEPLSRLMIRDVANQIRGLLNLSDKYYFPIVPFIENIMPQLYDDFYCEIVEVSEMKDCYAEALPQLNLIRIREDVYEDALNNVGRHRFTLAHEVGHFILHGEGRIALARVDNISIPKYRQPEWQANTFAGELLIPAALVKNKTVDEVIELCGVSATVAQIQLSTL